MNKVIIKTNPVYEHRPLHKRVEELLLGAIGCYDVTDQEKLQFVPMLKQQNIYYWHDKISNVVNISAISTKIKSMDPTYFEFTETLPHGFILHLTYLFNSIADADSFDDTTILAVVGDIIALNISNNESASIYSIEYTVLLPY